MILYLIIKLFLSLEFAFCSLIPSVETPAWLINNLPEILMRVASFNYYLPIFEAVRTVIFLIGFVLTWKIIKILLNTLKIDLNS